MAAADFNPYHFWLGIPADVEEPNHFQLLGLSESESDPNVITSSALRQSGFVRNFQRGEHADVATRILDEIEAAKLVLQHESRRREYRATLSPTTIDNQDGIDLVVANRPVRQANRRDHRTTRDHRYAIGICVGVLLVIVTAFVIRPGHKTDSATPIVTPSTDVDARPQTGEGASAPITPSKDGLAQAPGPVVRPSSAGPSTKTTGAETQQASTHVFGTLKGHSNSVLSVSFSHDGKRIVSGSKDLLRVWDAQTGREMLTLKEHSKLVWSVIFSPDGKRIVTGGNDGVKVWDAQSGQQTLTLKGHLRPVLSLSFSPDGKRIVSGSDDNTLKIWDAQTGQETHSLWGHSKAVRSVGFSPDGKRIVSGSGDNTLRVWDAQTGQQTLTLKGHLLSVGSVSFSPDGKRIASGSWDRTLKVWDAQTGQQTLTLKGHTGPVLNLSFSPDGNRIVSGSGDNTLRVWDAQTGQVAFTLEGHSGSVWSVSFSPDGKRIVSGGEDSTVRLWDVRTYFTGALKGHFGSVNSVSFSPDGKRIVSSGLIRMTVWNSNTGHETLQFKGYSGATESATFSSDGKQIVSSADTRVLVWNAETGQVALTLKGHSASVRSASFSPDGKRVVSGSFDKTVKVWNAQTGQETLTLKGHIDGVNSVSFSPDGKRIASGSNDKTVKVWDAETGRERLRLNGHDNAVFSVSFSPDGKRIASGSGDGTVMVWNAETGQETRALAGGQLGVTSVCFSPNSKWIVSGGGDGTVKLWNVETGQLKMTPMGHTSHVTSVSFSPDGKRIASSSRDNTVRLWNVPTLQPLANDGKKATKKLPVGISAPKKHNLVSFPQKKIRPGPGGRISTRPYGLSMYPPHSGSSSVQYAISGQYGTFEASVGIRPEARNSARTPLMFSVFGDNKWLWRSRWLSKPGDFQKCLCSVQGVDVLELRVTCRGPNTYADAEWKHTYLNSEKTRAPGYLGAAPNWLASDTVDPVDWFSPPKKGLFQLKWVSLFPNNQHPPLWIVVAGSDLLATRQKQRWWKSPAQPLGQLIDWPAPDTVILMKQMRVVRGREHYPYFSYALHRSPNKSLPSGWTRVGYVWTKDSPYRKKVYCHHDNLRRGVMTDNAKVRSNFVRNGWKVSFSFYSFTGRRK